MDMYAFIDELEARFDEARSCDLQELIDELTDAERASVTLSATGWSRGRCHTSAERWRRHSG